MSALSLRSRIVIASVLALFVFSIAFGIWQQAGASPVTLVADLEAEARLQALAPGEELVLADGTRLQFTGLVSDSRCPMDAMCPPWARPSSPSRSPWPTARSSTSRSRTRAASA